MTSQKDAPSASPTAAQTPASALPLLAVDGLAGLTLDDAVGLCSGGSCRLPSSLAPRQD